MAHEKVFQLPLLVGTASELSRLIRELEKVDDHMLQLKARQSGKDVKLPKTTMLLENTASENGVNLLHESHRKQLLEFLRLLQEKAPRLHFSFSTDPSPSFMEKLVAYLRKEIHPQALVTVGLRPTLGAGCILRVNSKQFDFSLKEDFVRKRGLLAERLHPAQPQPAETAEVPA